jgi:hypothetical protein
VPGDPPHIGHTGVHVAVNCLGEFTRVQQDQSEFRSDIWDCTSEPQLYLDINEIREKRESTEHRICINGFVYISTRYQRDCIERDNSNYNDT